MQISAAMFVSDDFVTPLSTPPNEVQSLEMEAESETQEEVTKKDSTHLLSDTTVLDKLYEKWVIVLKLPS